MNHSPSRSKQVGAAAPQQQRAMHRAPQREQIRRADGLQIDPGYYTLIQDGAQVGELLVLDLGGGRSREHWGLYSTYTAPSNLNIVEDLRFQYDANAPSVEDFARRLPSGATYVIADCAQQIIP